MSDKKFKIAVSISDVQEIERLDFQRIDLVFAGNPHCYIRHNNPLKSVDALNEFIHRTEKYRDSIVISLPICPMESDLEHVDNILKTVSENNLHGVEVQSPGMAMKVGKEYPHLKMYFGSFANVYTHLCASEMEKPGVSEGSPPCELDLDEITFIKNNSNTKIWLPVFGDYAISFSQYCYFHPEQKRYPYNCAYECEKGIIADFGDEKKIMHRGRAMFSHKCLNMLEHSEMLWEKGFRNFRIEGLFNDISSINEVAAIFYNYYSYISGENKEKPYLKDLLKKLEKYAPEGFCNGFYWTKAGMEFVN